MGIHLWYKFDDSRSSLRKIRVFTRCVSEVRTDGRKDRLTDGRRAFLCSPPGATGNNKEEEVEEEYEQGE